MISYRHILPALALCVATLPLAAQNRTDGNRVLVCNGSTDYVTATPLDITNDFTMELWANPSSMHQVDAESAAGFDAGVSGQRYAVYPLHGTACWGEGHAGAGISIGRNGISVYEHAANFMPAVLVYEAPVQGWTHVAVVYSAGTPSLYVNGLLVRTGVRSAMKHVHPSAGRAADRYIYGGIGGGPLGYFAGAIDEVRIWNRSLGPATVRASAAAFGRLPSDAGVAAPVLRFSMNRDGAGAGLAVYDEAMGRTSALTVGTATSPVFSRLEARTAAPAATNPQVPNPPAAANATREAGHAEERATLE